MILKPIKVILKFMSRMGEKSNFFNFFLNFSGLTFDLTFGKLKIKNQSFGSKNGPFAAPIWSK